MIRRQALILTVLLCAIGAAGVRPAGAVAPLVPFQIQLTVSGCPGRCPVWSASVSLDGSVVFDGYRNVAHPGRHSARISPEAVHGLRRRVDEVGFMSLRPAYTGQISDAPTTTLSILIGSTTRTVHVGGGPGGGAPEGLVRLISDIYDAAGLARWVGRPHP